MFRSKYSVIRTTTAAFLLSFCLLFWSLAHADNTQVLSTETVRSTGADGVITEKRIIKKIRARTVVDFEEANIEGKLKKPNAAFLMHGADLEFQHLHQIRQNQRQRILSAYEYVR